MGKVEVQRRADGVIEASLAGHIAAVDVVELHRGVEAELARGPARFVVIDTSGLENFSPDVRTPGVPFLQFMKASGVERVVAIATSSMVRMMASAIALAAGARIRFVADRAAADAALL